jgi:hypothetical protein
MKISSFVAVTAWIPTAWSLRYHILPASEERRYQPDSIPTPTPTLSPPNQELELGKRQDRDLTTMIIAPGPTCGFLGGNSDNPIVCASGVHCALIATSGEPVALQCCDDFVNNCANLPQALRIAFKDETEVLLTTYVGQKDEIAWTTTIFGQEGFVPTSTSPVLLGRSSSTIPKLAAVQRSVAQKGEDMKEPRSTGAIVGGVLGGLALLAVVAAVLWFKFFLFR